MFKRRIKKKCLPEWMGTSSEVETVSADPVCSVNLQNEDVKNISAAESFDFTKKESTLVKHYPDDSIAEPSTFSKTKKENITDQNEKKRKMDNKKRKLGIGFLDNSNMSSERELNSRQFDEYIVQSLPLLAFTGSIIYSYNTNDCCLLCEDLLEQLHSAELDLIVGFDMEWPVLYQKGQSGGKVALIQVSVSEEKCYLFHIAAMGTFPKSLKVLLQDARLKKVGINIESDLWKLERDFDEIKAKPMIVNSMIDLSKLANEKLKSSENWSLEGLCRHVLKMRIDKNDEVRCGNWQVYPLSEKQKLYAATDSYTGLKLFNTLSAATV